MEENLAISLYETGFSLAGYIIGRGHHRINGTDIIIHSTLSLGVSLILLKCKKLLL